MAVQEPSDRIETKLPSTPAPTRAATPSPPSQQRQPHSRVGAARIALISSAIVLALLLVFILQNGRSVKVSFLGASGRMPLGVAMLFAAIAGALLIGIPGTVRILQLRHTAHRDRKTGATP